MELDGLAGRGRAMHKGAGCGPSLSNGAVRGSVMRYNMLQSFVL